jgi:type II restriction enzyme
MKLNVFRMCVERIKKKDFSLEEVYGFEAYLRAKHPSNNNIQAKIRRQLQFLRDENIIDFVSPGRYRLKD